MSEEVIIPCEDQDRFFRVMAAYDEMLREQHLEFAKRKPVDHHTKCRYCGVFTPKALWVAKESSFGRHGYRPACQECASGLDEDYP